MSDKLRSVYQCYASPFVFAICAGLLAYMFVFTNKLVNHDELHCLFSKGVTIELGRWGIDLISYVFPDYSMPWLWGIVTLILISGAACVTISIFKINNRILQCALAGMMTTFPSLTGIFCYMFTSSAYGVAILFAVLSVYFFITDTKTGMLIALVFLVISVGTYQAYVTIAAGYFIIYLIQMILQNNFEIKYILIKGCKFVIFLMISLAIYYAIMQAILHENNMVLSEYASGKITYYNSLLYRMYYAYYEFATCFIHGTFGLINTLLSKIMHFLCMGIILLLIIVSRIKVKSHPQNVLLVVLLILLPLGINCIYMFVNIHAVHTLVVYGFVSIYVFAAMVVDTVDISLKLNLKDIVIIAMIVVIANNVFVANKLYLKMYMSYENMYAYYNSMTTQIKMTPGFDENTKIAIIGNANESEYMSGFTDNGIFGFPDNMKNINKELFITYYIGMDLEFATNEEIGEIKSTEEYKNMEEYPYYGSVQKIDRYIVVNLGE